MTNVAMEWYDKLFFASLALVGVGGLGCLIAFGAMLKATRWH